MFRRPVYLLVAAALAAAILLGTSVRLQGHCQIPCGIYNDPVRFQLLDEHIRTIEKSMRQIVALSAEPGKNANQIARWVGNKERHADEFAEIITGYFLQQRIKPREAGDADYVAKLVLCHRMLVTVMKAKQTTAAAHAAQLRKDLAAFRKAYMGKMTGRKTGDAHTEHARGRHASG